MPRRYLSRSPNAQLDPWQRSWPAEALSDEPPREVYLNACALIAASIQPLGFKYTKNGQKCYRERQGLGNTIVFQSSRFNTRGRNVQLWMHAMVSSSALQAWQEKWLPPGSSMPYFAGGMVHLLGSQYAMLEWELADPDTRAATLVDAVSFIDEEVIPYFSWFERPAELIQRLQKEELPGFNICPSVDFAYCFGDKQQAQRVLDRFVRDHPELDRSVESKGGASTSGGASRMRTYAQQIASLRTQYDLD